MNLKKITQDWIKISVLTLAIAGIYSIILVILRAPIFSSLISDKSIFKTSLVIHVDLSVLYWLICVICIFISEKVKTEYYNFIILAQKLILVSIVLICITPILGGTEPYMNNYIPMLHNLTFIIGLSIFFAAISIVSVIGLFFSMSAVSRSISLILIASIFSFFISTHKIRFLDYPIDIAHFYELVFWGMGHVLQFVYCSGFAYVLYYVLKSNAHDENKLLSYIDSIFKIDLILWCNAVLAVPVVFVQIFVNIDDILYLNLFTNHMIIFGSIVPVTAIIFSLTSFIILRNKINIKIFYGSNLDAKLRITTIFLSSITFLSGGLIAINISGINATIPAHYHGSIVGISIAFMGYIYIKCKNIFSTPNIKLAYTQLTLYCFGQIIHIAGLGYSGGYGALRKSPGQELALKTKIAMSVMGAGGFIAIIAGLMFVLISFNSIRKKSKNT